MNSRQIFAMLSDLEAKQSEAVAAGNTDEALRLDGEIKARKLDLEAAFDNESELRAAAAKPMKAEAPKNRAERIFGAKASFKGVEAGFSTRISDSITGLSTPVQTDTELERVGRKPIGFINTLPESSTNASETFYEEPAFDNKAAGWASGDKPESDLEYSTNTANLETVAHWIPIKKQQANRFEELEDVVEDALLVGLDMKNDYLALFGNDVNGIEGVTENANIQTFTYTAAMQTAGINIKDVIGRMATKVRIHSGMPATHVALSPNAIQALQEAKDDNGNYLFPTISRFGTIDGLQIVEDVNMQLVDITDPDNPVITEACLVYDNRAARVKMADDQQISIGLVNKQFIQNEYTMLAECTWLLKVNRPKGFCYCDDLLIQDSEQL